MQQSELLEALQSRLVILEMEGLENLSQEEALELEELGQVCSRFSEEVESLGIQQDEEE